MTDLAAERFDVWFGDPIPSPDPVKRVVDAIGLIHNERGEFASKGGQGFDLANTFNDPFWVDLAEKERQEYANLPASGQRRVEHPVDPIMAEIGRRRGLGGPRAVTTSELNAAIAKGGLELWRGCGSPEHVASLRSGQPWWCTGGTYGSGMYSTIDRNVALSFGRSNPSMNEPALAHFVLPAGARTILIDEAENRAEEDGIRLQEQVREALHKVVPENPDDTWRERAIQAFNGITKLTFDVGRWALNNGYDAILSAPTNAFSGAYVNVVNPAALLIEKP